MSKKYYEGSEVFWDIREVIRQSLRDIFGVFLTKEIEDQILKTLPNRIYQQLHYQCFINEDKNKIVKKEIT